MGMDYRYAGSASYPRFDEELCKIAKIFGGVKSEYLKQHIEENKEKFLGYWFGFLGDEDTEEDKFVFPKDTNKTLARWFNNIYGDDFTEDDTKEVWEEISKHSEIKHISRQLWSELETLVELNEKWDIW